MRQMSELGVGLGMTGLAMQDLGTTMLGQMFQKAYAASNDFSAEKHYIHLTLPGAPPRWLFDLPLFQPSATLTTPVSIDCSGFGFSIQSGDQLITQGPKSFYRFNQSGMNYFLPPVWGQGVGGKSFSSLLPNMMMIRGMDNEIAAHGIANGRQIAPIINGISLSGVIADLSKKPMPGVGGGMGTAIPESVRAFRSPKRLASVNIPGGANPLETLLAAFKTSSSPPFYKAESYRSIKEQSLQKFEEYSRHLGYSAEALGESYESAISIMSQGTYNLKDSYQSVQEKYQNLINQAISYENMSQVFSSKISPSANEGWNDVGLSDRFAGTATTDLRDAFKENGTVRPNVSGMAAQFAILELLILNNLTPVCALGFGNLSGLSVPIKDKDAASTVSPVMDNYALTHDQHYVGALAATLFTTGFYRAFLVCLCEFVDQLKANGKFDQTVIHLASDFNRKPKAIGNGSDHGPSGSGASLISGMFNQFQMTGNILSNSNEAVYPGTWGKAADYGGFGRPIQVNDVVGSIAVSLFGITNPVKLGLVTNYHSLFSSDGTPILNGEIKNV